MKVLCDACVWGGARKELASAGHDVIWASDWPNDPGDQEILARAVVEHRILVTLDKDFGELAIVHGAQHCGIIRLSGLAGRDQARMCLLALDRHGEELAQGAIVTVEQGRMRIRPADR